MARVQLNVRVSLEDMETWRRYLRDRCYTAAEGMHNILSKLNLSMNGMVQGDSWDSVGDVERVKEASCRRARRKPINVYLTTAERTDLDARAIAAGVRASTLLRSLLLERPIQPKPVEAALPAPIEEPKRLGSYCRVPDSMRAQADAAIEDAGGFDTHY